MSKTLAVIIALVSAGLGAAAGHFIWRAPQTPQQAKVEQQKCERLLARTQREPPRAPPDVWAPSRLETELSNALTETSSRQREDKISDIFEHLDPANIPELAAAIAKETPSQANNSILMRLLAGWRETDAEGALKFSAALPVGPNRDSMVQMCFSQLVDDDPASAEAYVATMAPGQLRTSLTGLLLDQKVHEDPEKALAMAAQLPPGASARQQAQLFMSWAQEDPESAYAAAVKLPKGSTRTDAIEGVADMWIASDLEAALQFFSKQDDKRLFETAMERAVRSAAADKPDLVASYLDTLPAGAKRDEMLETFASQWATEDMANAKAWATSLRDSHERDKAIAGLVQSYGGVDQGAVMDLVAEIHDPKLHAQAVYTTVAVMANDDPEGALRYALAQPKNNQSEMLLANVIDAWAGNDPRAAAEAIAGMDNPPERALFAVAHNWISMDPQGALRWADKLPPGESRTSVMTELSRTWAESDPQAAAELADRESNSETVAETARSWAATDPRAALDWLEHRRSNVGHDEALDAVVAYWAATDDKRALAWASDLRSGPVKNRALQQIAQQSVYEDPAGAAAVMMTMSGKERTEALARLYSTWSTTDAEAANAWLDHAGLSGDELASVKQPEAQIAEIGEVAPACVCPSTTD